MSALRSAPSAILTDMEHDIANARDAAMAIMMMTDGLHLREASAAIHFVASCGHDAAMRLYERLEAATLKPAEDERPD